MFSIMVAHEIIMGSFREAEGGNAPYFQSALQTLSAVNPRRALA